MNHCKKIYFGLPPPFAIPTLLCTGNPYEPVAAWDHIFQLIRIYKYPLYMVKNHWQVSGFQWSGKANDSYGIISNSNIVPKLSILREGILSLCCPQGGLEKNLLLN
jgi:hypothetical protein